jgi:tetratricopeptide (TPR) repeat protein
MDDKAPPPLSLALLYLRAARGWTQQRLAEAAGTHGRVVCDYETGRRRTLPPETFARLVAAMGYGAGEVHLTLLFVAGLLPDFPEAPVTPIDPSPADERRIRRTAAHAALLEAGRTAAELRRVARRLRAEEARREGARLWEELRRETPARQRQLLESRAELWSWALAERLCEESARAASDQPRRALELARLGLRAAELAPGEARWRSCLAGFAYAFVGNALRTLADLPGAEAAFATAWRLWRAGGAAAQGPLGEWRLLDLEASLRRDLRQFEKALELLGAALAGAPPERRGRILLNRGSILEQAGQVAASLAALAEAAPLLDAAGDAHDRMGVRFNWLVDLCHLGRHAEAETRLPELHKLVRALGNKWDAVRYRWLAGRVAAGLGRCEEARRAFQRVGREFAARRNAYDAALVALELAVLELEEGRFAAVKELAEEIVWVLASQRLHREALAALRLFVRAVQAGSASAGLARCVLAFLERARHDRALRFEGAA